MPRGRGYDAAILDVEAIEGIEFGESDMGFAGGAARGEKIDVEKEALLRAALSLALRRAFCARLREEW